MATLTEIRRRYPQYDRLSDDELAGALHQKFYSDMPEEEFRAKVGLGVAAPTNLDPAQIPPRNPPMPFGETLTGVVGEGLYGIPVVGPALLGAGARLGAAGQALTGKQSYSQALEDTQTKQENFRRNNPVLAGSAQAGGTTLATMGAGGTGPGARALGITGRNLATRSLASGTTGAAIGGADAYVRGNDPVTGTVVGGTFGVLAPAVGQGAGSTVRSAMGRGAPRIPSIDNMYAIRNQAYGVVDRLGARYTPGSYNMLLSSIRNAAARDHISPMRHPRAASMLQDMEAARATWARPASPTLTELDQLRQVIRRDVVNAGDDAEAHFGDMMMDQIDNFIDSATPAQMAAGNPRAAAAAIREARHANTQLRKAEMIDTALTRAARRANSTGSGGNIENTIRQNIRGILDNPNRVRAFTQDERQIMEQIVAPASRTQDIIRLVGKLSPSGNGLMAALGIGATATNPLFAIPAGAGIAAKRISEGMTQGRVNRLNQLVRAGGVAAPRPLTGVPDATRRAVQAITLGVPLSPPVSPLFPYLSRVSDSSAREPR
jgi:hypothetical protein